MSSENQHRAEERPAVAPRKPICPPEPRPAPLLEHHRLHPRQEPRGNVEPRKDKQDHAHSDHQVEQDGQNEERQQLPGCLPYILIDRAVAAQHRVHRRKTEETHQEKLKDAGWYADNQPERDPAGIQHRQDRVGRVRGRDNRPRHAEEEQLKYQQRHEGERKERAEAREDSPKVWEMSDPTPRGGMGRSGSVGRVVSAYVKMASQTARIGAKNNADTIGRRPIAGNQRSSPRPREARTISRRSGAATICSAIPRAARRNAGWRSGPRHPRTRVPPAYPVPPRGLRPRGPSFLQRQPPRTAATARASSYPASVLVSPPASSGEARMGLPPATLVINGILVDFAGDRLSAADGTSIPLRPQAFATLRHLIRQRQPAGHQGRADGGGLAGAAVTDDSLVQCIHEIRRALGDERHAVLPTVSRRGYRLSLRSEAPRRPPAALDRRAAVRQPRRGRRPGLLRRWPGRGHHHQPLEDPRPVRHRPQFLLRLSGRDADARARSPPSSAFATCWRAASGAPAGRLRINAQLVDGAPAAMSGPAGSRAPPRTSSISRTG